jgi:hypothetical protein
MVRLETIVDRLVGSMDEERKSAKESRQELWESLRELGGKMERSVTGLADEMKKMAEKRDAVDSQVLTRQSQDQGAIQAAKYIIYILLTLAAVTGAFRVGENRGQHRPPAAAISQPGQP